VLLVSKLSSLHVIGIRYFEISSLFFYSWTSCFEVGAYVICETERRTLIILLWDLIFSQKYSCFWVVEQDFPYLLRNILPKILAFFHVSASLDVMMQGDLKVFKVLHRTLLVSLSLSRKKRHICCSP
jgi:hypothetical protein